MIFKYLRKWHKLLEKINFYRFYFPLRGQLHWAVSIFGNLFLSSAIGGVFYALFPCFSDVPPIIPALLSTFVVFIIVSVLQFVRLYNDWNYYRGLLGSVSEEFNSSYEYGEVEFWYFIGESMEKDRWSRRYQIQSKSETVKFKDMRFGATGPGTPAISFYELQPRAFMCEDDSLRKLDVIPKAQEMETDHWEGAIYFNPPLEKEEEVNFNVKGNWPGQWNPLRTDQAEDVCRIELNQNAKKMKIYIVPPENMCVEVKGENSISCPDSSSLVKCDKRPDLSNRKQIICEFAPAKAGRYKVPVRIC